MTEAEWKTCENPARMLTWLTNAGAGGDSVADLEQRLITDRKLRLYACAVCRQVWDLLTDCARRAVEVAERYADGEVSWKELERAAIEDATATVRMHGWAGEAFLQDAQQAAIYTSRYFLHSQECRIPPAAQAALLREIVGNPFRRPTACRRCEGQGWVRVGLSGLEEEHRHDVPCPGCLGRWLTPTVQGVARRAYDEHDWQALPILADALEEAGADCEGLLMHLRGFERCPDCFDGPEGVRVYCDCGGKSGRQGWIRLRGPHVLGCFVLDLILGKE